ncbi:MAG TPA: helix-turn-helix transcriptional regulator [Terriglobia bacterium]|nr:helix-turn-helix transcriptional regulator [Terriglobia bacterium]
MRKAADSLGEFEQLVLTGVLLLGEHAYGLAMHEKISELAAPRNVRLGAVYMTLDRLKDKGLVRSWMSDPTPERGGRSKRYYQLTARGARALKESATRAKRISEAVGKLWGLEEWKPDRI